MYISLTYISISNFEPDTAQPESWLSKGRVLTQCDDCGGGGGIKDPPFCCLRMLFHGRFDSKRGLVPYGCSSVR